MRAAQDAIPGSIIPMWFVPIKTGTYEIVCAQLCGNGHSAMRATLVVDTEADYQKWFKDTAKLSGATVVAGQPVAPADSTSAPSSVASR
jgi:cytochrome c oxidase subunit 2